MGDTFFLGKYQIENETPWLIEWEIVHQTADYQIAMTKQIIDLRSFDAKEPNNTESANIKDNGNATWQYSNIKQFLNSDQAEWYSPQYEYDAPPIGDNISIASTAYDTHKGFLYYWSDNEKNALQNITFDLHTYNRAIDSYTWTGKVWLPTITQVGLGDNTDSFGKYGVTEGVVFNKYENASIKGFSYHEKVLEYTQNANNLKANGKYAISFSSIVPAYKFNTWGVQVDGTQCMSVAYNSNNGIMPCICLPRIGSIPGIAPNLNYTT